MDGFIQIPRALFDSEAWVKGSDSQKAFIIELYSRASFTDRTVMVNKAEVKIKKGEIAFSLRRLADDSGIDCSKLRRYLKYFEKYGIISVFDMVTQSERCVATQQKGVCTILRFNNMECVKTGTNDTPKCTDGDTHREESKFKQNNLPPYSPPDGSLENVDFVQLAEDVMKILLESNRSWVEVVCMKHELSLDKFLKVIQDFVSHRVCQGITSKSVADIMYHFENWYVTIENINKQNKQQNAAIRSSNETTVEQRLNEACGVMQKIRNRDSEAAADARSLSDEAYPF